MKVIVFGSTGMVGQGILRECLLDHSVTELVSVVRNPSMVTDKKLREIVSVDVSAFDTVGEVEEFDACFFCLGVSSLRMTEADYAKITYDLTLTIAQKLLRQSPMISFVYVSGSGTDSSETGPIMWARIKGKTENALLRLPFKGAYMFRPGIIQPLFGMRSKTTLYNLIYTIFRPLFFLMHAIAPRSILTTSQVGLAMLEVVKGHPSKRILAVSDIIDAAVGIAFKREIL